MALSFQPYNLSLPSYSPVYSYIPTRDGDPAEGWNSSYTGSTGTGPNSIGLGIAYHKTYFEGASVSLNFDGTAVYFCFNAQSSADYLFTVDKQPVTTIGSTQDAACAIYGNQPGQLAYADGLAYGAHMATLQAQSVSSVSNLNFYGGTVTISAGAPGAKIIQVIDDSDQGWIYNPNTAWSVYTDNQNMWEGSYHTTGIYDPGTTASYTFQGANAIILRGDSLFNRGAYTISLDNNPPVSFNATDYFWRHSPAITFFAGGLNTTESHTIVLTNYDANQTTPSGQAVWTALDTLSLLMEDTVQTASPLASSTPVRATPSSFPTEAIAAIVLGICVLVLLGLIAFLLIRMRRHERRTRVTQPYTYAPMPIPWAPSGVPAAAITQQEVLGSSATSTSPVVVQGREKGARHLGTGAAGSLEARPRAQRDDIPPSDTTSSNGAMSQPRPEQAASRSVRHFVENLSRVLNGQLREEYLAREGMGHPPEYMDDEGQAGGQGLV